MTSAYFVADGDGYLPTRIAQGPWGESVSGNLVGGILGHAIEGEVRRNFDPDLQAARLTVDLLRPVALAPLTVHTRIAREGRRLLVVDAELMQSDGRSPRVVSRAGALFLRPSAQPANDVWTSPVEMPPLPPEPDRLPDLNMLIWAYGKSQELVDPSLDLADWQHAGPKFAWLRQLKPLVDGAPLTPFIRAAIAGDVTSSLTHFGSDGLHFINADYTLALSRPPEGAYIGLAGLTHYSHAGIATGVTTLFDRHGPIGSGMATAVVNPGFAPPPF